jgi:hypothetical protein
MKRMKLCAAVLLAAGSAVSAQSLSTGILTGTTTGTTSYNGNFFDIMALNPGGITIESWETRLTGAVGTQQSVRIYYKVGTWEGFAVDATAWTLLGEVQVASLGSTVLTPVQMSPLHIPAGQTYGIRIGADPGGHTYSSGTFPNPVFNNDAALILGSVQTTLFSSTPIANRGWQGTIVYTAGGVTPTGRCCLLQGTCDLLTSFACTQVGGLYGGDGSVCAGFSCPQPPVGACCTSLGCTVVNIYDCQAAAGVYRGDNTTCSANSCQGLIFEVEPNNTKAQATVVAMMPGESLVGTSTASTGTADPASPDYFRIKTPPATLGIYRHRMTLSSDTVGHSSWVRGLGQTAAAAGPWPGPVGSASATESTGQSHAVVGTDRVNMWYGFGREEEVYYRVSGLASTIGSYIATLQSEPVTPTNLGTFQAGVITIDTSGMGHTSDTALRIYDENLNPVHGFANEDASLNGGAPAASTTASFLRREFVPGTYYMAITIGPLATNQGAPCDDGIRTSPMMDFANVAVNTGTATTTDLSFRITDDSGAAPVTASRGGRSEVAWYRMSVSGTVPTGACCLALGGCSVLAESMCVGQGGTYRGDNTDCATANCPLGACCLPDGNCILVVESVCASNGGAFGGGGTICATANCDLPLFANGGIITEAGTGFRGNHISRADTLVTSAGSTVTSSGTGDHFRLADDFTIVDVGGWDVSSLIVYGYITGAGVNAYGYPPVSPWTGASLRVWNGMPGEPGSAVVATSTTVAATGFTGVYRLFNTGVANNTERPIMYVQMDMGNLHLPAGTYWIDYQLTGLQVTNSTGFASYVMEVGAGGLPASRVGNARQLTDTGWVTALVPATTPPNQQIDFPFAIVGSVAGSCYANCDGSTVEPVLNVDDFTCFINAYANAQTLPHEQQVTAYANCDGSTTAPALNVDDFTCFINRYALGCP